MLETKQTIIIIQGSRYKKNVFSKLLSCSKGARRSLKTFLVLRPKMTVIEATCQCEQSHIVSFLLFFIKEINPFFTSVSNKIVCATTKINMTYLWFQLSLTKISLVHFILYFLTFYAKNVKETYTINRFVTTVLENALFN